MSELILPIAFSTYWLHAHGEGGGADFNLVLERDDDGLPTLRARHVTGLLRLALLRAQAWDWFTDDAEADADIAGLLLGERGAPAAGVKNGGPACLALSDARLSPAMQSELAKRRDLIDGLYARIPSTAIDAATGVAKPHHLRTVEAAVPVRLLCPISFEPTKRRIWARGRDDQVGRIGRAEMRWADWIKTAWPALDEAGAKRTRGFGRLAWRGIDGKGAST